MGSHWLELLQRTTAANNGQRMILALCLVALLVASNTEAQRIKGGGRRIITQPAFLGGSLGPSSGQFSVDDAQIRSFGSRRLYRSGLSQVPFGLSGSDYYSYPASLLTSGRGLGGKSIFADNLSGLSPIGARRTSFLADPTTAQFSAGDAQLDVFGGRNLYRTGLSPVPFGLSGMDYYSYPRSLLTRGGGLGGGLGQTRILSGGGFTADDSQVRGLGLGGGLGLADPIGQEKVTYIESAPTVVQQPQQVTTIVEDGGYGQRQVTTVTKSAGGLGGGLRGGQILLRGGPAMGIRRVKTRPSVIQQSGPVFVDATSGLGAPIGGYGQRQVVTKTVSAAPVVQPAPIGVRRIINRRLGDAFITQAARPRLAARRLVSRPQVAQFVGQPAVSYQSPRVAAVPGNIQFTLGNSQVIGGAVAPQRQVVTVQRPSYVQRPVVAVQQPQVISTTSGVKGRRLFGRQTPQLVYVDGGNRFLGYDSLGGYRIGDPRFNYAQLPINTRRFANLGLSQGSIDAGPILTAPAQAPSFLGSSPVTKTVISGGSGLGLGGIGQTSPAQIVTQEEVIGPAGDRQIVTTVQDAGPSKIGGPVVGGGVAGIGQLGATKTVTQEEVIGPAGDRQVVTTVTQSGPSKIGGSALGGGLAGIGQTGAVKTVTQEEVIGPAGDSQLLTTVTQTSPSKIGGPAAGGFGLSGIGQTSPAQVVTQEEVIGPAGDRQVVTTVTNAGPSKIGGLASGGQLGLAGVGQTGGTKTITQEEVIGPAGDSQILTTVTSSGPSKIGGPIGGGSGLVGMGQGAPTKVVTQEEVIGPAGDPQIVTTITESAGPSKIGGAAVGSPFATGQGSTKVITQEEVIGPAGDSQVITTVQETSPQNVLQQEDIGSSGFSSLTSSPLSQVLQDPVTSALSQQSLGDNIIVSSGGPMSQSGMDGIIGQSDISGGVGLLGQGGSGIVALSQQGGSLSDPIVQQSISSGFNSGYGYSPRVSFLSSYPYDIPSRTLLRQAVTRPFVQDQQQLEQILV